MREVTGLSEGGEIPEARIVNRTEWIRAATKSMRVMTGGGEKDGDKPGFISGRITGAQTGAVLAFISPASSASMTRSVQVAASCCWCTRT